MVRSKSKGVLHNMQKAVVTESPNISTMFKVARIVLTMNKLYI